MQGDALAAAVRGRELRRRDGRLRRAQPRRPRARPGRAAAGAAARRAAGDPRDHAAARAARALLPALVRRLRAAARQGASRRRRLHVPSRQRAPFPRPRRARRPAARSRLRGRSLAHLRRRDRGAAHRGRPSEPGDDPRDARARRVPRGARGAAWPRRSSRTPGSWPRSAREALAAGGKRLRPLLVFLASPSRRGAARGRRGGRARAHGDARPRRPDRPGPLPARPRGRLGEPRPRRRARGRRLPVRARLRRARRDRRPRGRRSASPARRSPSPAARRCSARQTHDPDTSVEDYLARCALKTGKLFEAACLLGSGGDRGLGEFGLALGIAFQIADDILDCSGETIETGKIAGTDLREGTPTLPLILAAREDETVRRALAGGPLDGALVRVAETGALESSRELALDYARRARACLDGHLLPRRARGPDRRRRGPGVVIRLGRISYVNMAPVFHRLEAEVEEVQGVPTELNARLLAGELDLAPISSIEYARNADRLRLLPRLCVSSEGAVDSIQLVARKPLEQVRTVAVTPESATSVVLTKVLLPEADARPARRGGRRDAADRRRRAEERLRGPDAAPRPRPPLAGAHGPADGLRRLGLPGAGPAGPGRARAGAGRVGARPPAPSPSGSPTSRASATAIRPASWPATSRSCATASARASAPGC